MNRGHPWILMSVLLAAGCASLPEQEIRARYREVRAEAYGGADAAATRPVLTAEATLDDYLKMAFARNPVLRQAFEQWAAAMERVSQARALEDPVLSFEYFIEQLDTRYQVSLTQMIPAFGKLGLRDRQAAAEAGAAGYRFEAERLALFDRVIKAFHEYHYLSRITAVTAEHVQLLAGLEQVVASRYQAGLAPFSDLIKVQVEKDRLANEQATLQEERRSRSAVLAAQLNLPVYDVLPWPKAPPSGPAAVDVETLDAMLEDLNPELKAAEAMIHAAQYREKLARRNGLPNFMLGAGWMVMPGMAGGGDESDFALMAGITLPLWRGTYRAGVREAGALMRAAVLEQDGLRNELRVELSMAIYKFRDAERRIALFATSLIPKAVQARDVAEREFASGRTDFMDVIDAQRTLLEFQLLAERAMADREIALGEIGCCIGKVDVLGPRGNPAVEGRLAD